VCGKSELGWERGAEKSEEEENVRAILRSRTPAARATREYATTAPTLEMRDD
jgi:hypothetical protein